MLMSGQFIFVLIFMDRWQPQSSTSLPPFGTLAVVEAILINTRLAPFLISTLGLSLPSTFYYSLYHQIDCIW